MRTLVNRGSLLEWVEESFNFQVDGATYHVKAGVTNGNTVLLGADVIDTESIKLRGQKSQPPPPVPVMPVTTRAQSKKTQEVDAHLQLLDQQSGADHICG